MSDDVLRFECLRMAMEKFSGEQAIKMAEMMFQYVRNGKK